MNHKSLDFQTVDVQGNLFNFVYIKTDPPRYQMKFWPAYACSWPSNTFLTASELLSDVLHKADYFQFTPAMKMSVLEYTKSFINSHPLDDS